MRSICCIESLSRRNVLAFRDSPCASRSPLKATPARRRGLPSRGTTPGCPQYTPGYPFLQDGRPVGWDMPLFKSFFRRADLKLLAAGQLGYLFTYLLSPEAALWLTLALLLSVLSLVWARIRCATAEPVWPESQPISELPFVSIQLATYSEPPDVVCKTLDTLSRIDYPNFEVLVLDNNTSEEALYAPVREHCSQLGSRFRFCHFEGVSGAKAGALNIATELASPATEIILVLDADYCVAPEILREGLKYFATPDIALVQFPQAYRNASETCGLTWEYRHFFNVYMNVANKLNTVLSTGTALLIRKAALQSVGGWPTRTLTEDAELGLRLHKAGLRAVYVPQVVSRGLMPTDLPSLKAQRRRWVLGNAQSLGRLLKHPALSPRRKLMMLLQLTAWCNPLGLCTAAILTGLVAEAIAPGPRSTAVLAMSMLSTACYLLGTLLFFLLSALRHKGSLWAGCMSYLVHLGMFWEGAFAWGEIFLKSDRRFVRTNKFLEPSAMGRDFTAMLTTVGLTAALWWLLPATSAAGVCLALACLILVSRAALLCSLNRIHERTTALLAKEVDGVHVTSAPLG